MVWNSRVSQPAVISRIWRNGDPVEMVENSRMSQPAVISRIGVTEIQLKW